MRSIQGNPIASDVIYSLQLSAGGSVSVSIPSGSRAVTISGNSDIWVRFGDGSVSASVPEGNDFSGNGSALVSVIGGSRTFYYFSSDIYLSVASDSAAQVSLEFFS